MNTHYIIVAVAWRSHELTNFWSNQLMRFIPTQHHILKASNLFLPLCVSVHVSHFKRAIINILIRCFLILLWCFHLIIYKLFIPDPEPVPSPVPAKQYRSDYEYNGKTDAFYKLHSEGARKRPAIAKCTEEGAELLKITSEEDLKQVRAMMKKFPDLTDPVIVASIGMLKY